MLPPGPTPFIMCGDANPSVVRRLDADELELAVTTAYLGGRVSEAMAALQRAEQVHARRGDHRRAARSAFWLGFLLLGRGELAQGSGWLARARRLLDDGQLDCVEQGYLLLPLALQRFAEGDVAAAYATFGQAAKLGDRFGDRDLATIARAGRGHALLRLGDTVEGLGRGAVAEEVLEDRVGALEDADVHGRRRGR